MKLGEKKFKAVAGAGAGAKIMDKVEAGAENKLFRLRNTVINVHD